jgi:hypothetical protein
MWFDREAQEGGRHQGLQRAARLAFLTSVLLRRRPESEASYPTKGRVEAADVY